MIIRGKDDEPNWLANHRDAAPYTPEHRPLYVAQHEGTEVPPFMRDLRFNKHESNDGTHVSPYDEGAIWTGLDGVEVRLIQGVDEAALKRLLSRTLRATTGIHPDEPEQDTDWEEMMRGGLQSALESQVVVFEVHRIGRTLTHQLVRTRKAAFHQQSQRATWFGDRPDFRMPINIYRDPEARAAWEKAILASWEAYKVACDRGHSYQDARYILPEGTVNYIICEYPLREFLNVYAYRACSMFLWEMVGVMREMGRLLVEAHPFLEPYVKISCEKGPLCNLCKGSGHMWSDGIAADPSEVERQKRADFLMYDHNEQIVQCPECKGKGSLVRKCTFQGWENVEGQCSFPWAKQSNRTFLPTPKFRIGDK